MVEIGSFRGRSAIVLAGAGGGGRVHRSARRLGPRAAGDRCRRRPRPGRPRGVPTPTSRAPGSPSASATCAPSPAPRWSEVPGPVDVLFVDGAHRFGPARADLVRWGDRVRPGGRMLVHDAWSSVGVTLALLTTTVFGRRWRYVGRDGIAGGVRARGRAAARATPCASCASCRGSRATSRSRRSSWRACAAGRGPTEPCDAGGVLARAVTSLRLRALDLGDRALGRARPPRPAAAPARLRGRQRLRGHRRRAAAPGPRPRRR